MHHNLRKGSGAQRTGNETEQPQILCCKMTCFLITRKIGLERVYNTVLVYIIVYNIYLYVYIITYNIYCYI